MKIGEYVRTKHYGIFKVLDIFNMYGKTLALKEKGHTVTMYVDEVIKEDFEVINLIEVGDYVNGIKVNDKGQSTLIFYDSDGDYYLDNENIETIVTKEQFESMEYKIGE